MEKEKKSGFIAEHFAEVLLSVPKTLYLNFKVLPLAQAAKLPIFISYHVKLRGINRTTFLVSKEATEFASIRIGFGGSRFSANNGKKGLLCIENGSISMGKRVGLSQGIVLDAKNGCINLGNHFRCNYSVTIACEDDNITIGEEVVFGWNVSVKNSDGHYVVIDGVKNCNHAPITIGEHVWVCAESHILKGTHIGRNSVVAYGSLLTKANGEECCLYGGTPATIIREHINWEE